MYLLAFYSAGDSNSYLIFLTFLEVYLTFSCAFMRAEALLCTKCVVWGSTAGRPHPTDTGLITDPCRQHDLCSPLRASCFQSCAVCQPFLI